MQKKEKVGTEQTKSTLKGRRTDRERERDLNDRVVKWGLVSTLKSSAASWNESIELEFIGKRGGWCNVNDEKAPK